MNYVDGEVEASYAYGYDGFGSVAELTNQSGVLETAYSYTPYGVATATGNTTTGNPYNYQGEMVDPSTGNQYLRARYYNQSTGTFQTQDSYLGDIKEPLTRNLYTYAENNPVNFDDPSGHGIWSSIKKGVSKVTKKVTSTVKKAYTAVKTTVSKAYNTVKTTVSKAYTAVKSTAKKAYNTVKTQVTKTYNNAKTYVSNTYKKAVSTTKAAVNYTQQKAKTAYEKAVEAGTSSYNWVASKSKEAQNIAKNWTKALEENMKHVCTSVKYAGDKLVDNFKSVDWKDVGTEALNGVQTALDVAGLVPGFGEIADGVNVLIYAGRGDLVNAGLSAAAMIPFLGWGATGGKAVNKVVKYGDDVGKVIVKHGDEVVDVAAGAVKSGGMKLDLQFFAKKADDVAEGASNSGSKNFRDLMSSEEATRYDNYWKQGSGSFNNIKLPDGTKVEVINNGNVLSTRQRLQVAPGTRSITDVKYSSDGSMYYRETIFDQYGRRIGNNDYTNHGKPYVESHTIPHHHPNPATNPNQHGKGVPGLHPETP